MTTPVWRRCRKRPIEVKFREVEPKTLIRVEMPGRVEVWGEVIEAREGLLFAYPDKDYIIMGVQGEIYPIGKDIFSETYDIILEGELIEKYRCTSCGKEWEREAGIMAKIRKCVFCGSDLIHGIESG